MMFSAATKASLQNRWQSRRDAGRRAAERAVRLSLSFVRGLPKVKKALDAFHVGRSPEKYWAYV
jgi:hypothetical protein